MRHYSIAIDGPAASGKSTTARGVAKRLGFVYVDTGAMYRAFTVLCLEEGADPKNEEECLKLLDGCDIFEDSEGKIYLNGRDVTERVREKDVTNSVSYTCAYYDVRVRMVELQRKMASSVSVVMDGRDIGTVVLKDADLKVYLTASIESRAKRRLADNEKRGMPSDYDEIKKDIERRDYIDSHRENSPLSKAEDAIVVDTSNMSIEEEIERIILLFEEKVGKSWKD